MEKSFKGNHFTVQGVMTPVPAALGSARAGYQSSLSSACNVTPVSLARVTDNATSINQQMEQSPFVKSSVIKRTPPTSASINMGRTATPTNSDIGATVKKYGSFDELGAKIIELMDYVKNRNNVHHAIKEMIREIRVKYNKVRDEIDEPVKPLETKDRSSQTSPKSKTLEKNTKRSRDQMDAISNLETPKRQKKLSPIEKDIVNQQEKKDTRKPFDNEKVPNKSNNWATVGRKNRLRKPKPDTVIISSKGETSYADILRKLRSDPELQELGNEVNKVRRTQKGDLLLELKSTSKGIGEKFNNIIETSLEGNVIVKTHKEEIMIECKDMDDITTKSEICFALEKEFGIPKLEETVVKSIRKSYGGTQTAKILLPAETARKALAVGKVKIGWSLCRIRDSISITTCYRCLEFGHIAKFCKSETDRSNHCRKCGVIGHISKNCETEPNCMLCIASKEPDVKHIAGSYKCPLFKKALNARYK